MAEFFERPPSRKARHSASSERRVRKTSKPTSKQEQETYEQEQEIQEARGDLHDDFQKFCRKFGMTYVPLIENRVKRSTTPTQGRFKKISDEVKENEPPETTLRTIDNYEYFRPKIQVEKDVDQKIKEIYIRGWKVDLKIMQVFEQCFPPLEKLTTLNLWNCGLNEETIDVLVNVISKCSSIKNLILDGNNIDKQVYHKLLTTEKTVLQLFSARNCAINDSGAEQIGKALRDSNNPECKLITLNLSGNKITDVGAIEIGNGLRSNRSVLVLNLSGNRIGDEGAKYLAESLSKFKLTHDEIVQRRHRVAEKLLKERPLLGKANENRPSSQYTTKSKGLRKDKSDDKLGLHTSRDRSKSKEPTNNLGGRESSMDKTSKKKDTSDAKGKDNKKGGINSLDKNKPNKKGSKGKAKDDAESDTSSLKSASGFSNINMAIAQNENNIIENIVDEPERIDGVLWMPGNRVLISLNLSRNQISIEGIEHFHKCMQYQLTLTSIYKNQAPGLLRLDLSVSKSSRALILSQNDESFFQNLLLEKKNLRGTMECEAYEKIIEIMKKKDPILNKPKDEPFQSETTPNSSVVKETPVSMTKKQSK